MKILVIDDSEGNQKSARKTLKGHEVTIAKSFDEAVVLMGGRVEKHQGSGGEEYEQLDGIAAASGVSFPYKVVLTDMNLPFSRFRLSFEARTKAENVHAEPPYGFILALRAVQLGAKFVAMATNINHHQDPLSAAIEVLGGAAYWSEVEKGKGHAFRIDGAKVMFVHAPLLEEESESPAKDWGRILKKLIAD
ncbi:MAG: hypothetical protein CEN90_578 [Parcubacteria group bacterium Licking1014_17]|nr:MAG: hypothetical protein CEN90_578 [Parcubacteria group bacterium Licking1014_17]